MSSPKVVTYTMKAFDGKLNEVFRRQSKLSALLKELQGCEFEDKALGIQFGCKDTLYKIAQNYSAAMKSLIFDYKGSFNSGVYNKINNVIQNKLQEINNCQEILEKTHVEFQTKKADYNAFTSILSYIENSKKSFDDYKEQVNSYMKTTLAKAAPELVMESETHVDEISLEIKKPEFSFGFAKKYDLQKNAIINEISLKEENIGVVRSKISDKAIEKTGKAIVLKKKTTKSTPEISAMLKKIKNQICDCEDASVRKLYKAQIEKLSGNESLNDLYYYKELHDSILEAENTRRKKIKLNGLIAEINKTDFHETLHPERSALIKKCLDLLNEKSPSVSEIDFLTGKMNDLVEQNGDALRAEDVRKKEREFMKSQILLKLEDMGYEVMDDLEVIDFEKNNDFLLKVRNQENYLNLKFKDDGSFRYSFQIPENKNELSADQVDMKLHEMKSTCNDFMSVLDELKAMGVKIDIKEDRPMDLSTLISVTKDQQDKIKSDHIRQKQIQQNKFRKRYLDLK